MCLFVSVCVWVHVSVLVFVCRCVSECVWLYLSVCVYVSLCLSLFVWECLNVWLCVCFCLYVSLCVRVYVCLCDSLCVPVCLSLSDCVVACVCLCLCVSECVSMCLFMHVCMCATASCLYLWLCVCVHLSVSVCLRLSLTVWLLIANDVSVARRLFRGWCWGSSSDVPWSGVDVSQAGRQRRWMDEHRWAVGRLVEVTPRRSDGHSTCRQLLQSPEALLAGSSKMMLYWDARVRWL